MQELFVSFLDLVFFLISIFSKSRKQQVIVLSTKNQTWIQILVIIYCVNWASQLLGFIFFLLIQVYYYFESDPLSHCFPPFPLPTHFSFFSITCRQAQVLSLVFSGSSPCCSECVFFASDLWLGLLVSKRSLVIDNIQNNRTGCSMEHLRYCRTYFITLMIKSQSQE